MSYIDNEIASILWKPIFSSGDRRILDLIIAFRKGWFNIRWVEDIRDWQGVNPDNEYSRPETIPRVHDSVGKLINLIKTEIGPDTMCMFKNGTISIDGKFYRASSYLNNMLQIYMEYLEEKYG